MQELTLNKIFMNVLFVAIKEMYPKCLQEYGQYQVTTVVLLKNHYTMTVLRVLKLGAAINIRFWEHQSLVSLLQVCDCCL